MNYWPISNGQMLDLVGCAHMQQGVSTFLTSDRFGQPNAALSLNYGYTSVPSGAFFNSSQWTFTGWIYVKSSGFCCRLLEFSNINAENVIALSFSDSAHSLYPFFDIFTPVSGVNALVVGTLSSIVLQLNQWSFVAVTFDVNVLKLYINGVYSSNGMINMPVPLNLVRAYNHFGKSQYSIDAASDALLDEMRIYYRCLTSVEINALMNI